MMIRVLQLVLAAVLVLAGFSARAAAQPAEGSATRAEGSSTTTDGKRLLVLTKSSGFEHSVVKRRGDKLSLFEQVLTDLGEKHGWNVTCTKDASIINAANLKNYDAVALYTTGELLQPGNDKHPPMTDEGRHDLIEFVRNGGGLMGWHSAPDTFHSWEENGVKPFVDMLGAEFLTHGAQFVGTVRTVDADHPIMKRQPAELRIRDEWYIFKNMNKKEIHVLAILDTTSERQKQEKYDIPPYPITWCRTFGKGRVFYSGLGHREDVLTNKTCQDLMVDAAKWIFGETQADAKPNYHEIIKDTE